MLEGNARQQVTYQAELLLDQIDSIRTYTVEEVRPLTQNEDDPYATFHPQSVPAYAATQVAQLFSTKRPNYSYKEAVLNPTNLRDKAAPWERNLIETFKTDLNNEKAIGSRIVDGTKSLYIAKPITITNQACLEYHSTPERAPKSMIKKYGSKNGFGWEMGEVVGIRMLLVPFTLTESLARNTFQFFLISLFVVLLAVLIAVNFGYHLLRKKKIKEKKAKRRSQ